MGGTGEMRKAPIGLQDLRRRLYVKAQAEPSWRFWGLYGHLGKRETLRAAYRLAQANNGVPGSDEVPFEGIAAAGVETFLTQRREEVGHQTYRPLRLRKVGMPQAGGTRHLLIPAIRDRVVQGTRKLLLEPIFAAAFQAGSYGYRPKRSAHAAIPRGAAAIVEGKPSVIDLDLKAYCDQVRHHIVLAKVAERINDRAVMRLRKLLLQAAGKQGVAQGRGHSPLLRNLYGRLFGRKGTVALVLP
jgi:RNA-directed DNA polymerase